MRQFYQRVEHELAVTWFVVSVVSLSLADDVRIAYGWGRYFYLLGKDSKKK